MKKQITLSGVGGQGLISTGEIIGEAASIFENLNATLTCSYGSETRGTFTKSDVIISDEMISYPNVDSPDIILCLAQVAYDQYVSKFTENTKVFYDSAAVKRDANAKGEHFGYAFRDISIQLGNMQVSNTIALGVMIKKAGILHRDSILSAIMSRFKGKHKIIDINKKALDYGLNLE
jgi:2-oxoglutarate ferredoxin oxidoreductase subunit gamma